MKGGGTKALGGLAASAIKPLTKFPVIGLMPVGPEQGGKTPACFQLVVLFQGIRRRLCSRLG